MPITLAAVDDHPMFRKGVMRILEQVPDFTFIIEASNGQELVEKLATQRPDVILMDLEMPLMNGIQATQHVKEHWPEVKVIVVSMHDQDQFVTASMEAGANGYLLKDTDPEEVEKAIRKVIEEDYYYGDFLTKVMHRKMLKKTQTKETSRPSWVLAVQLSERELEVLKLICEGFTNTEIAEKIFLSPRTVDGHRTRIMEKVGVKNTAGLVVYAVKNQLY